ncbi:MAG: DUF4136 domain-containing protein [Flavitalea sp.]
MKLTISILAVMFLLSCGGPRVVSSELNEGVDMNAYKTFDFYGAEASGDTIPGKFRQNLVLIKDAIRTELSNKGFTQNSNNPDLLVNIGVVVDEKVQTRETDFRTDAPRYIGQRNYSWKSQEIEVSRYRMGTGTVELVDPKQNKIVWRGVVEDVLPSKPSKTQSAIKETVAALFKGFPG